jgi:type II secretory pathway pseudopilin PulG
MRAGRPHRERGFTFVIVIALVAVMSIGLAAVGPLWAEEARREREEELLRVGALYAAAINRYRESSPGSAKPYPKSLEALLLDTRFVGTVRHLRSLYPDPVGGGQPWGLVRADDGGIRGVYSLSEAPPLRVGSVQSAVVSLGPASKYSDWLFVVKGD